MYFKRIFKFAWKQTTTCSLHCVLPGCIYLVAKIQQYAFDALLTRQ